MKIYLIRHGQTTGDVEDKYGGAYDDNLTENGIKQAQKLANILDKSNIQFIYSSPLKRAQQTANILGSQSNCQIKIVEDLKERNKNGILTGMTKSEAQIRYPNLVEQLKDYRNQIEGAESQADFERRIQKIFSEIISSTQHSTIGIVTHGMVFWVIFANILKNPSLKSVGDCAFLVLNKEENNITLEKTNGIQLKT